MSEFLAESYISERVAVGGVPRTDDLSRAARQLTEEGRPVRLLRAVFVPVDETCFYLFEAESSEAVAATACRCGLRFERLTAAVSDRTPAPAVPPGDTTTEGDDP